jgi:hypothetical protein
MCSEVYLAVVEDPSLWDTTEQVLVVFLHDESRPPDELVNPAVIGMTSAEGVWRLLLRHKPSHRAFYEEVRDATGPASALPRQTQ